jgi:hypothetical protein
MDSTASAIRLQRAGWDVTLGHVEWLIEGHDFGWRQTHAARTIANRLDMPMVTIAEVNIPLESYAKYAWMPVCIALVTHHAGDPCEYPAPKEQRYDAISFGTHLLNRGKFNHDVKRAWVQAMRDYAFSGPVLMPVEGWSRKKTTEYVPEDIRNLTVCCYQGPSVDEPCGKCYKCTGV